MGSNRIAPMPTTPAKNTADIAIEMQPTNLSAGSLHSQAAQTEPDNNDQSVAYALSKSSGYAWIKLYSLQNNKINRQKFYSTFSVYLFRTLSLAFLQCNRWKDYK